MSIPTRKAVRAKIQEVLQGALLARLSIPTAAVYRAQVTDLQDRSPGVGVFSAGTRRTRRTHGGPGVVYYFLLQTRVLFSDPAGTTWNEDDAEDAIDDIEAVIAQSLLVDNLHLDGYWKHIEYVDRSQTTAEVIGGTEYRGEGQEIEVLIV